MSAGTFYHYNVGHCEACKEHLYCGTYCKGGQSATCDECAENVCSLCADSYESEGGYGEDGQDVHTHAMCKACAAQKAMDAIVAEEKAK